MPAILGSSGVCVQVGKRGRAGGFAHTTLYAWVMTLLFEMIIQQLRIIYSSFSNHIHFNTLYRCSCNLCQSPPAPMMEKVTGVTSLLCTVHLWAVAWNLGQMAGVEKNYRAGMDRVEKWHIGTLIFFRPPLTPLYPLLSSSDRLAAGVWTELWGEEASPFLLGQSTSSQNQCLHSGMPSADHCVG